MDRLTFDNAPDLLKPEQVQELLQISRSTFFRWVYADKLPGAVKIGSSWRVKTDELRKFLNQQARS